MNKHIPFNNPPFIVAIFIPAVPFFILSSLVYMYSVNIPYQDDWGIVYLFENYYSHNLTAHDFWCQHNEHRLVIPKLIFFGLGILSKYNVTYEMFLNVAIAFIVYIIMILHINKNKETLNIQKNYRWLWIILSFFVFSLVQVENWLWGFQLQWYLNVFGVICGAYIFSNFDLDIISFLGLVSCGLVATFSLSNGILYWIIILLVLFIFFIRNKQRKYLVACLVWALLFSGVLCLYLYKYTTPLLRPGTLHFLRIPILDLIVFMSAYIGSPVSYFGVITQKAVLLGLIGIIFFIINCIYFVFFESSKKLKAHAFFIIIGSYSLFSSVLTTIGRADFGLEQALSSRYTTISILLWNAVFFFIYILKIGRTEFSSVVKNIFYVLKTVVLVGIFCLLNYGSFRCFEKFQECGKLRREGGQSVLKGYGEGIKYLHINPEQLVEADIPRLRHLGLSVFNSPAIKKADYENIRWNYDRGWAYGELPPYIRLPIRSDGRYYLSSWDRYGDNVGTVYSEHLPIDGPISVNLLFAHGMDIEKQKVGAVIWDEIPIEIACDSICGNNMWRNCSVDLSPYAGESFSVFADDNGTGIENWTVLSGIIRIDKKNNDE